MIKICIYNIYDDDDFDMNYPRTMMTIPEYWSTKPNWKVASEDTFLIFESLSEEQNMEINRFGVLDFIYPQLAEAALRLEEGKDALLRTAGEGGHRFFLLEPQNEIVALSVLGDFPTTIQHYYPLTNSPSTTDINNTQKEELYTYLATHKEDLKHHIINNSLVKSIHNIQMPLSTVITALKEQADFGAKLYKSLYKE